MFYTIKYSILYNCSIKYNYSIADNGTFYNVTFLARKILLSLSCYKNPQSVRNPFEISIGRDEF